MIAFLVGLCSLAGAVGVWDTALGRPPPTEVECRLFTGVRPIRVEGVVLGPTKDKDGDMMWLVRVTDTVFAVTWREPKALGDPT